MLPTMGMPMCMPMRILALSAEVGAGSISVGAGSISVGAGSISAQAVWPPQSHTHRRIRLQDGANDVLPRGQARLRCMHAMYVEVHARMHACMRACMSACIHTHAWMDSCM